MWPFKSKPKKVEQPASRRATDSTPSLDRRSASYDSGGYPSASDHLLFQNGSRGWDLDRLDGGFNHASSPSHGSCESGSSGSWDSGSSSSSDSGSSSCDSGGGSGSGD